jgi:serine/threonine protein kinase
MIQKISEGTYGFIYCDKNNVYKISKSKEWDCSMIRETYLLSFLKECNYIVKYMGCISPNIADKYFGFLIKDKLVERIEGIILERMDCNLKDYCIHIFNSYNDSPEILSNFFKKIFEKCLLGLYDIHKYYILHNDLKLINILISYKDKKEENYEFDLKFCDFGLGIQTSSFSMDDILCLGTCKYSAPEMRHKSVTKFYKKKPQYPQSLNMDIYSIGVIVVHVLCLLTNKKPLEKVTSDTFMSLLDMKSGTTNPDYFYSYEGYEFLNSDGVNVILSMLDDNPKERSTPRNCLKSPYFATKIPRFKFVENTKQMLVNYTYEFDGDLYLKFENKMKEWNFDTLPFEVYLNIFHCMLQIKYNIENESENLSSNTDLAMDNIHTNKQQLSFMQIFKLSIGWVLSIYHHRESQRYRKMIASSSDKTKFKKFEYKHRYLLEKIRVVPFMAMFKNGEIKNEIHKQKIFNYIFS